MNTYISSYGDTVECVDAQDAAAQYAAGLGVSAPVVRMRDPLVVTVFCGGDRKVTYAQPEARPLIQPQYLSCAETAKIVRNDLKVSFPGVKFSVRSSVYSGGASIRIKYADGPLQASVERVVKRYEGASFDGMIDLKSYHLVTLRCGTVVHSGADFIFVDRCYTRPFAVGALEEYDLNVEVRDNSYDQYVHVWSNNYSDQRQALKVLQDTGSR